MYTFLLIPQTTRGRFFISGQGTITKDHIEQKKLFFNMVLLVLNTGLTPFQIHLVFPQNDPTAISSPWS